MTEGSKPPFHSFSFWILQNGRPRTSFRMSAPQGEGGFYTLKVSQGPASRPSSGFTREVPQETAVALRDALQGLGVFGWQEEYGDETAPGKRRWALNLVFQEGVFSVEAKGGSDVPPGFDGLLEELYHLDFPRLDEKATPPSYPNSTSNMSDVMGTLGAGSLGAMSAGDLSAYAATSAPRGDLSFLRRLFGNKGIDGQPGGLEAIEGMGDLSIEDLDMHEVANLFARLQSDPGAFEGALREEFRQLPHDDQERLLDALAASGYASRAWWERLLRGI